MKKSTATLCSLSLCLWGYQTGAWNLAIPMILALELRHFIKHQRKISWEHFKFIHVLAALIWLLAIFYIPASSPSSIPYAASYHILKCIPIGLFPLILCQTYCINFTSLYSSILNQRDESSKPINLYYPYFGICLLSASATGGNTFLFLGITAGLVTLFLGSLRSSRFSPTVFYGLIGAALVLSIVSTNQYYWVQANFKPESPNLFGSLLRDLNFFSSKISSEVAKNLLNEDSLQKASQHTKNLINPESKSGSQSNQSAQNTETPQTTSQPTQAQQNSASQNVAQTIKNIQSSENVATSQSPTQSTGSSQAAESSQNAVQSTQGGESSQNTTPSSSGLNSLPNSNQQSGQSGSISAAASSQGSPQSIASPNTTPDTNAFQESQSGASPNNPSQPSQNGIQNPDGLNHSPSSSNLIQQGGGTVNPQKSLTQIGNTGSLQPSDAVLFRVALNGNDESNYLAPPLPLYLREAAYNQYSLGAWSAVNSTFSSKDSVSNKRQWSFGNRTFNTISARISATLPQGKSMLKLPLGVSKLEHPAIDSMQVNQYGAVMVQGTPGESTYTVQFDPTQSQDASPTQIDIDVPSAEKPAIQTILKSLNLKGQSDHDIIQLVTAFFKENFTYSLKLSNAPNNSTPLAAFLLDHRSGHCEYFASATSLLLRSAGIPTRYVVGYSASEYSPSQQEYTVRARNAHAWVMAYVNGSWMTVDTTPGSSQLQNANNGNSQATSEPGLSQHNNTDSLPAGAKPQNGNAKNTVSQGNPFKALQTFIAKISDGFKLQSTRFIRQLDPMVWSGAKTNSENGKTTSERELSQSNSPSSPPGAKPQDKSVKKPVSQGNPFEALQTFVAKTSDQFKLQSAHLIRKLDPMVWSGAIIILGLAITLISMFLAWWISRRHFSRRSKGSKRNVSRLSNQLKDSLAPEFYLIENRLREWGVERKSSETVRQWIVRLKQKLPDSKMNRLNEIIDLHYRYRFDPQGIEPEDCTRLNSMIKAWLMETAA